eukprot:8382520-Pyramimonas_sp.AAC.1
MDAVYPYGGTAIGRWINSSGAKLNGLLRAQRTVLRCGEGGRGREGSPPRRCLRAPYSAVHLMIQCSPSYGQGRETP